jgi:hypothetical protein
MWFWLVNEMIKFVSGMSAPQFGDESSWVLGSHLVQGPSGFCVSSLLRHDVFAYPRLKTSGLRHQMPSPAQTLGSWVRIPLEAQMSVRVSSACIGSGLATRLITHPRSPTECLWDSYDGKQARRPNTNGRRRRKVSSEMLNMFFLYNEGKAPLRSKFASACAYQPQSQFIPRKAVFLYCSVRKFMSGVTL